MRGCIQFFFICLALANPLMRNQSKMTKYICELREQGVNIVKMFSYRGRSFKVDKEYDYQGWPWVEGLWIIHERNKWGCCLS